MCIDGLRRLKRDLLSCFNLDAAPRWRRGSADLPTALAAVIRGSEPLEARQLLSAVPITDVPVHNSDIAHYTTKTIYLDFNGHTMSQYGDFQDIDISPYNRPGSDEGTFDDTEQADIAEIHRRIAEHFSPFSVNVTTVEPGSFANGEALRLVIGGDAFEMGDDDFRAEQTEMRDNDLADGVNDGEWFNAAGFSLLNAFTNSDPNVAFAFAYFPGAPHNEEAFVGIDNILHEASHEAGHSFGLRHHVTVDPSSGAVASVLGNTSGRAPIMGYPQDLTERMTWWSGPAEANAGSTTPTTQDDLAVLSQVLGHRLDDHGDTAGYATPLTFDADERQLVGRGVIEQTGDVDTFSFVVHGSGPTVRVVAEVWPESVGMLDATLELRDHTGAVVSPQEDGSAQFARIDTFLAPGEYRLVVGSHGDYGDVGQYHINVVEKTGAEVIDAVHLSDRRLRLTFDKPIDGSSFHPIHSVDFKDRRGNPPAPAAGTVQFTQVDANGRVFDLSFPDFRTNGLQITVGKDLKDRYGNTMRTAFTYEDFAGPRVERTEILWQKIRVHFSEPIDPGTFTMSEISLADLAGGAASFSKPQMVAGSDHQVFDIPLKSYPVGGFHLRVRTGIRDEFGNALNQNGNAKNGELFVDDYHETVKDRQGPRVIGAALSVPVAGSLLPTGGPASTNNLLVAFSEPLAPTEFKAGDVTVKDANGNSVQVHSVSPYTGSGFNAGAGEYETWLIAFGSAGIGTTSYDVTIGPHVEDFFGNEMDQNSDGLSGDKYRQSFTAEPTVLTRRTRLTEDDVVKFLMIDDRSKIPTDPLGPYAKDEDSALAGLVDDAPHRGPIMRANGARPDLKGSQVEIAKMGVGEMDIRGNPRRSVFR